MLDHSRALPLIIWKPALSFRKSLTLKCSKDIGFSAFLGTTYSQFLVFLVWFLWDRVSCSPDAWALVVVQSSIQSWGWPWISDLLASTSQVRLQTCTATHSLCSVCVKLGGVRQTPCQGIHTSHLVTLLQMCTLHLVPCWDSPPPLHFFLRWDLLVAYANLSPGFCDLPSSASSMLGLQAWAPGLDAAALLFG